MDAFGAKWDAQALLQEEVNTLRKRVEALIKWTEDFEDQVIFLGRDLKADKGDRKPEDIQEEEVAEECKEEDEFNSEETQQEEPPPLLEKGEVETPEDADIFGASPWKADFEFEPNTKDTNFEFEPTKAPNFGFEPITPATNPSSYSLVQWD